MKIGISILIIGLMLSACQSGKRVAARRVVVATTEPVDLTVRETVQDTFFVEEKTEPTRSEKVVKTHGADLMQYCVIVGSFIYERNAVNLRSNLMQQGFLGSSIMRNSEGMYRVSVGCSDSHDDAWKEVCRIRSQYPQFSDAWLLKTSL